MPEATILLADDHPRLLEKVRRLLEPTFAVVGAVGDGSALIAAARELEPQLIITDLRMEPRNGLEAVASILSGCNAKPLVIMLTAVADQETAREAFAAGIQGFVLKTRLTDDLIPAIHAVLAGSQFLSPLPRLEV